MSRPRPRRPQRIPMLALGTIVLGSLWLAGATRADEDAVRPGAQPPREVQRRVHPLLGELAEAQRAKDVARVSELAPRIIEAMGAWAGNPEEAPRYYRPVERNEPRLEEVWRLWRETDRHSEPLWVQVPDGDPLRMKTGLRGAGGPILAYLIVARLRPDAPENYRERSRTGCDYLLKLQRPDGLFPFPDLRGRHKLFGPMLDRLLRRQPEALQGGWIVDDAGGGDAQFDQGICGVAMVETYEATGEAMYLEAARRAADWAAGRPISTNWNYNAFSVWFLARLARATGEKRYLASAVEKICLGVLPGQMQSGRWFDPHNAKLVYHGILVRGILETYRVLPAEDPLRKTLRESLARALDNAAAEIRERGASSISTTTEMLSQALLILGPNAAWEEALRINVNAGIRILGDRQAPVVGREIAHYLAYRQARGR